MESLIRKGANAFCWQEFSDGEGQAGGKHRWTESGESVPDTKDAELL